jgi:hypothetical protein
MRAERGAVRVGALMGDLPWPGLGNTTQVGDTTCRRLSELHFTPTRGRLGECGFGPLVLPAREGAGIGPPSSFSFAVRARPSSSRAPRLCAPFGAQDVRPGRAGMRLQQRVVALLADRNGVVSPRAGDGMPVLINSSLAACHLAVSAAAREGRGGREELVSPLLRWRGLLSACRSEKKRQFVTQALTIEELTTMA